VRKAGLKRGLGPRHTPTPVGAAAHLGISGGGAPRAECTGPEVDPGTTRVSGLRKEQDSAGSTPPVCDYECTERHRNHGY
jgi:hypothetical protein